MTEAEHVRLVQQVSIRSPPRYVLVSRSAWKLFNQLLPMTRIWWNTFDIKWRVTRQSGRFSTYSLDCTELTSFAKLVQNAHIFALISTRSNVEFSDCALQIILERESPKKNLRACDYPEFIFVIHTSTFQLAFSSEFLLSVSSMKIHNTWSRRSSTSQAQIIALFNSCSTYWMQEPRISLKRSIRLREIVESWWELKVVLVAYYLPSF